jgi:hypothetical protein
VLAECYNTMDQVRALLDEGHLMTRFRQFWEAAVAAEDEGRLHHGCRRLTHRDDTVPGFTVSPSDGLRVEVLGPVVTRDHGLVRYRAFADPKQPTGQSSAICWRTTGTIRAFSRSTSTRPAITARRISSWTF